MNLNRPRLPTRRAEAAHSLPEAIFAALIVGTMVVSLYAGFTSGFTVVQLARENLRATEVMLQHMESVRLYTWSQLQDTNAYLKPTFTEPFNPEAETTESQGVVYAGHLTVGPPEHLPAGYSNDVRVVTVSVYWTNYNGNVEIVRGRQMQTLVARHGIQNYVIGR